MGYVLANLVKGGTGCTGLKHTDEAKRKVSEAHKGKKLSLEQIEKIRITSTGRKHTEKTKEYLRSINLAEKNPMFGSKKRIGAKHSEETKKILSEKRMGWAMPDWHKEKIILSNKGKKHSPEHIKKRIAKRLSLIHI